ncbi:PadR family transcriptional regulator [Ignatzschineria rhizosphaerae]|uniref:PadR family transcriptional regulator n=1 Tax=Ignatzschineria rhizosphaerae TaxID=2923279 RepID=A0ABY3X4A8_9GAMM|nr:PadR family transcriptional regulator [Ignatzschineria rhizosphaerae]UNM95581.1 PadR family transcriptional regulator [Ignatzschineria rhizosphaerae]
MQEKKDELPVVKGQEASHGKRLKRLFERGDLQLLILLQLKTQNAHGYELMKLINEQTAGIYEPSPGVLYPTLSMLEDQGFIEQDTSEVRRKIYRITTIGQVFLKEHYPRVEQIKARLSSIDLLQNKMGTSDGLNEAIGKFKMLIRHQICQDQLSKAQMNQIIEIIHRATDDIEKAYQKIINQ